MQVGTIVKYVGWHPSIEYGTIGTISDRDGGLYQTTFGDGIWFNNSELEFKRVDPRIVIDAVLSAYCDSVNVHHGDYHGDGFLVELKDVNHIIEYDLDNASVIDHFNRLIELFRLYTPELMQ